MTARRLGIYCLDVGQGDATLIVPPVGEGDPVLFDCRDDEVIVKLLAHWQYERLHAVVVSHLDWDHIAGVKQLLEREDLKVANVYMSTDRQVDDETDEAKRAKSLLDYVVQGDEQGRWSQWAAEAHPGPIHSGPDWAVEILAPRHAKRVADDRDGAWEKPNVYSAVLSVRMQDSVVLIGGDAPLGTWKRLADRGEANCRVFRVPHHGGALSDGGVPHGWSAQALYAEIDPAVSIVSVGSVNRDQHPDPDWIGPACTGGRRLCCTQVTERCQPGLRQDLDDFRVEVMTHGHLVEADWWHLSDRYGKGRKNEGVPCAGTVVVTLYQNQVRVRPLERRHRQVVAGWDEAQCRVESSRSP